MVLALLIVIGLVALVAYGAVGRKVGHIDRKIDRLDDGPKFPRYPR